MTEQDWYAVGPGRSTCRKCGEERLVHEVADGRGIQNFCPVCCHSWWVQKGPLTAAQYRAGHTATPKVDVSGHLIDGP